MKTASFFLFTLLASCAGLTGCVSAPRMSEVGVSLVGFRPVETPTATARAIMTLRFHSQNTNAQGFTRSSHQLYFGSNLVGKAENVSPVGLPSMGILNVDVVLEISDPAAVRRILAVSDKAKYRLESVLTYTENEDKYRYKTSDAGSVELQGLEQAVADH